MDEAITIATAQGNIVCDILAILNQDERDFVVLLPLDKNGDAAGDIYIYELVKNDDDEENEHMENITDKELYKTLYRQFLNEYSVPQML